MIETEDRSGTTRCTNSIGMDFIRILPGSFIMGETGHKASISRPFCLSKYPVTQEQWMTVMDGKNPSLCTYRHNRRKPVNRVSWNDAQDFISSLNQMERHNGYRLPTELEWVLAAKGVTTSNDEAAPLVFNAWDVDSAELQHHLAGLLKRHILMKSLVQLGHLPVKQEPPKPSACRYNLNGDLWEWMQDWYAELPYQDLPDYRGPKKGAARVCRLAVRSCTNDLSGQREVFAPALRFHSIGFRLALSL